MRDYSKITKPTPEHYCAYCGKKMERKRINGRLEDLGAFKRRKYCDWMCMRKAFVKKDASTQDSRQAHASAKKIAYLIGNRDKICEICGSTQSIDVHHKDGDFNNNSQENLMVLCRSCHMKLHRPKPKCVLCGKPVKGHGYCNMHLIRYRKFGNPLMYQGHLVDPQFNERART